MIENTTVVVDELGGKYGFDVTEALEHLGVADMKINRAPGKGKKGREKPKKTQATVPLPYCGVTNEDCCRGIRLNHGLMTQCVMACCDGGDYCTTCQNQANKNANGLPTYGRIEGRGSAGWRTPGGKQPVEYGNVMEKLNITRETATQEAAKLGLTIPEEQFAKREAQRGRPAKKKGAATSDTESEDGKPKEKKKRGRPKKDKKVVSGSSGTGDDLIASLMHAAAVVPPVKEQVELAAKEPVVPTTTEPVVPAATKQVLPAVVENAEAAALEKKRLERNAKAKAKRDEKKAAKAAEAAKAAQVAAPLLNHAELDQVFDVPAPKPVAPENVTNELVVSPISSSEDEDDAATKVDLFEFGGKKYLKDEENNLYDAENHEHVGQFDEVNQCIDYCEEEEED